MKNGALPKHDDTVGNMNFVFVADEAFALTAEFLKPFSRKDLTQEKQIFNYRLSRARRCVENAFGVLAARFPIFLYYDSYGTVESGWHCDGLCRST